MRKGKYSLAFFIGILLPVILTAQLKLPALISDSMVLQRERPVTIWGWSLSGTPVNVSFQHKTYQAKPDAGKRWEIKLPAMKAGRGYTMEIETANDKRVLQGIAVGDVWLCSGQSNMAFDMAWASNMFPNDIAQSANPDIREFHVALEYSFAPKTDIKGRWAPANPANTGSFTAVGYYMVKALYEKYKIPMGILHSSWGGSSAEAWTSEEGLKDFNNYLTKLAGFTDSNKLKDIQAREKQVKDEWYKNVDANDKGLNGWSDTSFDASGWKPLQLPGYWENQGAGNVDGAVWVRKEINLTRAMTTKDAILELGIIDDIDHTYFNGKKIGLKQNKYTLRNYKIPASLLKEGKNIITIRIVDTDGNGGFIPQKKYRLITSDGEVSLSGTWHYAIGYSTAPLPVASFIAMHQQPTSLFNAMIAPLVSYTIKGAAWYQGETNVGRGQEYQRLLPSMIADWRNRWKQGAFPFLIVQLANFKPVKNDPEESMWAELRESQELITQKVSNTGLAVAIDVGEAGDVHPLDKKTVGVRLALAARKIAYGEKKMVYSGPTYQSMKIRDGKIVLSFSNTDSGLITNDGGELKQFAIAGKDGRFIWASARIERNKVIVWNEKITDPVAVRYAWADNPEGANLYNKEGLPASPFRTDRK